MSKKIETGQGTLSRRRFCARALQAGGAAVGLGATVDEVYQGFRFHQASNQIAQHHDDYLDINNGYMAYGNAGDALNKMERDLKVIFVSIAAIAAGKIIPSTPDKPTTI